MFWTLVTQVLPSFKAVCVVSKTDYPTAELHLAELIVAGNLKSEPEGLLAVL